MFFPKLRRRAKWVFLALAIAFAGGFLFFGVGAGGSGIGDYFAELFNRTPSAGTPEVQAYQADGQISEAIASYERYRTLRPEDADALRALAALYGQRTAEAQERAERANAEAQAADLDQTFAPESPFVQEITGNRVSESVSALAQARAQTAQAEAQRYGALQTKVYEELTLLVPDDPLLFLQFAGAAEAAQDYESAIAAYERFLALAPDDPSAAQVRERIKLLESIIGTSG
jgi:tetratricopeptide (TPR) repeat protein